MAAKYPPISLCMIAKNEEDLIAQAIGSVKGLVSEIILVDTGSSDKTAEIAASLGAKVLHRPWDDDFSAPRNLSIAKASADWILVLDADEAIDVSQFDEIRRLTLCKGVCYEIIQRHYSNDVRISNYRPCRGEFPAWERSYGGYFDSHCVRLFPNHEGLHYQNRIHELVEPSIEQLGKHRIVKTKIVVHHYGHTPKAKASKNKAALYTALGEKKAAEHPHAWKNHFELGVEHNCNGRREQAAAALRQAVDLNPRYLPAWVNLGYVLCELGRHAEAEAALKRALELEPRDPEAHCNLGVVYMRTADWRSAETHFRKALAERPDYVNAMCNLGQTLLRLGRNEEAIAQLTKAVELTPKNAGAKADLGSAYLNAGNLSLAYAWLDQALKDDPGLSRSYYYYGQTLKFQGRFSEAIAALEKFCILHLEERGGATPAETERLLAGVKNECEFMRKLECVYNSP